MSPPAARGWTIAAILACAGLSLAQFALIGRIEFTFDEAYYALWSRGLAWGYYDHPPMIAGVIRASTTLFGADDFGARALNALAFAALPLAIARIAWRLFGSDKTAAMSALFFAAMPLTAGAPLVTPDAPLTIFSTLALLGFVEARAGQGWGWPLFGGALGLAALSKFTAAFVGAGLVLAWLVSPDWRARLAARGLWLALALVLIVVSPFLLWNAAHDWATFAKQLGRVPAHGFAPGYLLEFVGGQIGLANPLIVGLAVFGRAPADPRARVARRLLWTALTPALAYFALHALHDRVQGNWLAPFFPMIAILAADAATHTAGAARLAGAAAALGLGFTALAYLHAATLWPRLGPADPLARIGGWRELTAEVDGRARAANAAFVLTRGYAATSLLTWYGSNSPPVVELGERDRWRFQPAPGPALFSAPGLAFGEAGPEFAARLAQRFQTVEWMATLSRRRGGQDVGAFALYRVAGPLTPDPAAD